MRWANATGTVQRPLAAHLPSYLGTGKWHRCQTTFVGHPGNLGQSNYSASKAGIIGMSKSLAVEYAKKNITINCVSPGFIETKMTDKISEDMKSILISRIPMNKLGTGLDVSNTVAFLSSDAASYITGETIHVNGGMYMAWQTLLII